MKTGLERCVWIPPGLSASLSQDSKWKFRPSVVTRLNPFARWLSLFLRPLFLVVILPLLSIPAASQETPAPGIALLNGDLIRGNPDAPESWDTRAYKNGAEFTTYRWNHAAGAPANLEISSIKPN